MRIEAICHAAAQHLNKLAEDADRPPFDAEPEDVRRLRRLRKLLSRVFNRSRSMKTISVLEDLS